MEISLKNLAIAVPVIIVASFMVGRYTVPSKTVTKTEVQKVTTTKQVDKDIKDVDKDVIVTETDKPDGTKIKQTQYVDRVHTESVDTKNSQTSTDTKTSTVTTNSKGDWNIAALAGVNSQDRLWEKQIGYGAIVQRRIIGPFYLGAYANGFGSSSQSYGLSLGGSF